MAHDGHGHGGGHGGGAGAIDRVFFGGVVIIFVVLIALYALTNLQGPRGGAGSGAGTGGAVLPSAGATASGAVVTADGNVCQCFDQAFSLAGSGVDVTSAQYRTGFEQCRAVYGPKGGAAWTAGWNARVSAQPFQASCRNFLNNYQ
ncbi:MAG: hypothetical protein K2Q06_10140 [Parvularculaceae bacterium]|nr:hypothetical protein [Parvularculaceae bacterium]